MHHFYEDIITPLGDPIWWDEYAVPRYCEFSPKVVANIYAHEVVFFLIACQACRTPFKVAMSFGTVPDIVMKRTPLADRVKNDTLHYGDPPNIACCGPGPTMNCLDIKVLEFWRQEDMEWARVSELEVKLEDGKEFDDV